MKLYHSGVRQNAKNARYIYETEIKSCEDIIKVVSYDNTCAKCKDNYRKNDNFIQADCSMFDVDNTHSEKPTEWVYPKDIRKMFPNVSFYVVFSRNHMKEKNGKAARPKFHIYFKDKLFTSLEEYTKHKQAVCEYFTAFDPNAKDATRFFFGVENPQVEYYEGATLLADFMKTVSIVDNRITESMVPSTVNEKKICSTLQNKNVILEGCRNSTLISYAVSVLKRYGDKEETAHNMYIERSECCSPPLGNDEIQSIWKNATKFYNEKIKQSADYIDPELFDSTKYMISAVENEFVLEVKNEKAFTSLLVSKNIKKDIDIKSARLFLASFGITLRHNSMTHRTEIDGLPNIYQGEEDYKTLCTLTTDILKNMCFRKPANLSSIFDLIALENCYHPVIEKINNAEWDGENRLPEIYNMLGIDDELSKSLVRKWAIQTIAMLFNDNKKPISAQGILVLQGKQGVGKTEFFRHLAIEDSFFKEGAVVDVNNKDTQISTTSTWICEIGELDSTTAKKQSELKSFLTLNADDYRIPYDKYPVKRVRRTSFCGTVNPTGFLTDETGNRRYWTIHIDKIDLKKVFGYSSEWYTQFWRQIFCEYFENPKSYLLSPEQNEQLNKRNENYEADVYGEDEFLATFNIKAPIENWTYLTVAEIVEILNEKYKKLNLSSSAFGKSLIPKLERRFNVEFKKKIVSGRQFRHCPPKFFDSCDDDFSPIYRIGIPTLNHYDDFTEDNDDVIF